MGGCMVENVLECRAVSRILERGAGLTLPLHAN